MSLPVGAAPPPPPPAQAPPAPKAPAPKPPAPPKVKVNRTVPRLGPVPLLPQLSENPSAREKGRGAA
jgi:protein TonB